MSTTTQQSVNTSKVSHLRASGSIWRAITMFTSGQAQMARNITASARNVLRGHQVAKNLHNIAVLQGMQGVLYGFALAGYYLDDEGREDIWWSLFLNNLKGVALVGRGIEYGSALYRDLPWQDKVLMANPIADAITDGGIALKKIAANQDDGDKTLTQRKKMKIKRLEGYMELAEVSARILGLPMGEVSDRYNAIVKRAEGSRDFLEIIGLRTPRQVARRENKK